jgi:hypothetical protein
LGNKIKESFRESQKASEELNDILEKAEASNDRLRDRLLDWLASLEKKDNGSVEEIEEQIRKNQADIAQTKREIEENNKRTNRTEKNLNTCAGCQKDISEETSYYFPNEQLTRHWCSECYPKQSEPSSNNSNSSTPLSNFNQINNSLPVQSSNQQENSKCYNCKKVFNQGENTNYLPQLPDKKWCDACDFEVKICFQAAQQIFQGQKIDVDNLNISQENKTELKAIIKLKNGEDIDIDKLNIDQESKAILKAIQAQIEQGQIPTNIVSPKPFYAKGSFWIEAIIPIFCVVGFVYQIYRWRKAKREGKKYSWWTDKIV